uniref:AlNc14C143G7331 protein n=1 Tax=Albugo laibachii Nc14 TaxID=890382 RepID=F0WLE3_9STRA|nr:AlNc14C143G7331 [Albugo laibachii Nc14]|eukprot:CCA22106.1 AlNc14C143G7331 [Albugo laibachii Nc14]
MLLWNMPYRLLDLIGVVLSSRFAPLSSRRAMGRYTSVQTYTDQDAKVATISYSAETSVESKTPNDLAVKTSDEKSHTDAKNKDGKFHFNRVDNVLGSSAGAGSGEFHVYRASRRREMERVARMEKEHHQKIEEDEFEKKRAKNLEEFEGRIQKKAKRRRLRKVRAKSRLVENLAQSDPVGCTKKHADQPTQFEEKCSTN